MKYMATILAFALCTIPFYMVAVGVDAKTTAPRAPDETGEKSDETIVHEEREWRAENRAFYTAPPVIPHELYPVSAGDCLTCHQEEREYFGKVSTRTPHPHLTNCTQCHLPSRPAFTPLEANPVESEWRGLASPTEGTRANLVAPPTMPHRKLLREDCESCHSHKSPFASMRGPHPERTNCTQCHLAFSDHEFKLSDQMVLPTR